MMTHYRMSQCSVENFQDVGLFVMSHSSNCGGKRSNLWNDNSNDNEECFEYGSKNHWKLYYPVWNEKQNKMKIVEGSFTTNVSTKNTSDERLTVMEESNREVMENSLGENSVSSWILDYGCSYHVYANKLMFDT